MRKKTEYKFYIIVKTAIEDHFKNKGYNRDFEITANKKKIPKRFLKDNILIKQKHLPIPDIMGLVWRSEKEKNKLVIVEFKEKPNFRDIFQAKRYDELFDADHTYLLSQKPLYESSKKVLDFVKLRPFLLNTKNGKSSIIIKFLDDKRPKGCVTLANLGPDIGVLPLERV